MIVHSPEYFSGNFQIVLQILTHSGFVINHKKVYFHPFSGHQDYWVHSRLYSNGSVSATGQSLQDKERMQVHGKSDRGYRSLTSSSDRLTEFLCTGSPQPYVITIYRTSGQNLFTSTWTMTTRFLRLLRN